MLLVALPICSTKSYPCAGARTPHYNLNAIGSFCDMQESGLPPESAAPNIENKGVSMSLQHYRAATLRRRKHAAHQPEPARAPDFDYRPPGSQHRDLDLAPAQACGTSTAGRPEVNTETSALRWRKNLAFPTAATKSASPIESKGWLLRYAGQSHGPQEAQDQSVAHRRLNTEA